jgi:hypothetical protein
LERAWAAEPAEGLAEDQEEVLAPAPALDLSLVQAQDLDPVLGSALAEELVVDSAWVPAAAVRAAVDSAPAPAAASAATARLESAGDTAEAWASTAAWACLADLDWDQPPVLVLDSDWGLDWLPGPAREQIRLAAAVAMARLSWGRLSWGRLPPDPAKAPTVTWVTSG